LRAPGYTEIVRGVPLARDSHVNPSDETVDFLFTDIECVVEVGSILD